VAVVSEVKVLLDEWEHQCHGDLRRVGDTVTMSVYESEGLLIDKRHDYGKPVVAHALTGRVVRIGWRPAILVQVNELFQAVEGYGPAVSVSSTDDRPPGDSWAFEFTIEAADT
jgi:hypothetical protein